jgi:hypothetical protein
VNGYEQAVGITGGYGGYPSHNLQVGRSDVVRQAVTVMRELTQFERAMLRQLRAKDGTNPKGYLKRTSCQFVHDYGWFYDSGPLPHAVGPAIPTSVTTMRSSLPLAIRH